MTTLTAPSTFVLRKRQAARPLVVAVVASVALHAVFFLLLAVYLAFVSLITPAEVVGEADTPTITLETLLEPFDITDPLPPPDEPDVDPREKARNTIRAASKPGEAEAPENPAFESDRNQYAAAPEAPSPDPAAVENLPTMAGTDKLPGVQLEDTDFSETPEEPRPAQPEQPEQVAVSPQEAQPLPETRLEPEPELLPFINDPTAPSVPVPEPTEIALDDVRPVDLMEQNAQLLESLPDLPTAQEMAEALPPPDPTAADSEQRQTEFSGTISASGDASVDAADTPAGRYSKAVNRAVEVKWRRYMADKRDYAAYSTVRVAYSVNAAGEVADIRLVGTDAGAVITDATLNSILDAEIPPIPAEVLEVLDNGLLYMNASFTLY